MSLSFAQTNKNEGLLAITFDDGYKTDYTFAYPEMKKRGMLGTTYVVGYYTDNIPLYMTSEQLLDLHRNGWDLQCHTFDHSSVGELTASQTIKQMKDNEAKFAEIGLPRPTHFAFPWGRSNSVNREAIKKYRLSQRTTPLYKPSLERMEDVDPHYLGAYDGDIDYRDKLTTFKGYVDRAVSEKKILVVYWHEMTEIKKQYFIEFLDYVKQSGIKTVTHSELYEHIKWRNFQYKYL